MAIIEPFERHYTEYENWFEKSRFAYWSELAAVKEFIPAKRMLLRTLSILFVTKAISMIGMHKVLLHKIV